MSNAVTAVFLCACLFLKGCPQQQAPEQYIYDTLVVSKAFINTYQKNHPECATATTPLCSNLAKATSAQHSLADVAEVVCAGPNFDAGNACDFPKKGTPAYAQAQAKLSAAMDIWKQAQADLKGVTQ